MKSNLLLKVWGIILTVAILSGLLMVSVPVAAGNLTWSRGSYPSAYGATAPTGILDIVANTRLLAVSPDGKTMFSYNTGTFVCGKSTDSGVTFSNSVLGVTLGIGLPAAYAATMLDIAPDNATVIISDGTTLYGSGDGGVNFSAITIPAGFGAISCMDVTNGPTILIGGTAGYAIYKSVAGFGGGWSAKITTGQILNFVAVTEVVQSVMFSPNYATDGLYVIVTNDGAAGAGVTYVRFGYANASLTLPLGQQYADQKLNTALTGDNTVLGAKIAFPADFDLSTNANILVGVNSVGTSGGVWKIAIGSYTGAVATTSGSRRLSATPTLSVAMVGSWAAGYAYMIDSTGTNPLTYATGISGATSASASWVPSSKSYTGTTGALFASNADSKIYVMGNGANAGLSVSTDNGVTFNQINYITIPTTTAFTQVVMVDANTIFIVINNGAGASEILRYANAAWQRINYNTTAAYNKLYVSPSYATDSTLYVTTGTAAVYKSVNGGSTFSQFVTNGPGAVLDMAVVDATNFFYITAGSVFKSSAMFTALSFPAGATFATLKYVSPTLIYIGGSDGKVYKSVDGAVFAAVGAVAPFAAGDSVYVAADATTLYAACGTTAGSGVKSWSTTTSTWSAYGTVTPLPGTVVIKMIDFTSAGVVYALDTASSKIYRIADGANWELLTAVTVPATNHIGFKLADKVYGFTATSISNYTDTLAVIPTFTTPATGTTPLLNKDTAAISWNAVTGNDSANATYYKYWVSTTSDITSGQIGSGFSGTTTVFLPGVLGIGTLINGMTYYVQIQAVTGNVVAGVLVPVSYSKKSAVGSFATKLTNAGNNPGAVSGMAPAAGGIVTIPAGQTSASPAFQWAAVANATSYEIKISSKSDFSDVIDSSVGLTSTVYQTPVKLAPGTYYWELRAVAGTNQGDWIQSVFQVAAAPVVATSTVAPPVVTYPTPTIVIPTQPAPVVNVTVPTPTNGSNSTTTPPWAWVVIAIGAVLVIAVIVLIVRTRRV